MAVLETRREEEASGPDDGQHDQQHRRQRHQRKEQSVGHKLDYREPPMRIQQRGSWTMDAAPEDFAAKT